MIRPLTIHGAYQMTHAGHQDARGTLTVLFDQQNAAQAGLQTHITQINYVENPSVYTLRGMHYQSAPHEEAKWIRCLSGSIYDVMVDIRPDSPTFRHWTAVTLESPTTSVYIPAGCAHGYLTLTPGATVLYTVSAAYHPASACGFRWNDPAFSIAWPHAPAQIHDRDASYADWSAIGA